ncbi:hypothetical protein CPCC7001_1652 [Cyanobium sp. PCC 7001]|uniref:hypothetical protein n=1 Tax=Cyanobium sp. PCC 7001 TaxID=180281 RepID=UPI0001805BCE|nr:hypothetical protein [Cyanobium sp. PCC 7001]EDY38773.1 hypothetical protein CPCC7001_1652 [Cyanobium sp. PCC 7001]
MAEFLVYIQRGLSRLRRPVTTTRLHPAPSASMGLEDLAWLIGCPLTALELTRVATGFVAHDGA